jgi:two-component system aerobic respiration control sensor histidine kinase ArcB
MLKLTMNIIGEELPLLNAAHEKSDWQQVAKISHKLKGGFLNIGLTRAAIACQYLERYHKAGHRNLLEQLYLMVLKVLDETAKNIQTLVK